MTITFEQPGDDAGLEVVDDVERHRYSLSAAPRTAVESVDPERMMFPVDAAAALDTGYVETPDLPCIYVRDGDGGMLAATEPPCKRTFPVGQYYVEICAPVKLYLRVHGEMAVEADLDCKRIRFGDDADVLLGARSKHDRPAGTITTTADPTDVMAAISTFGSALKATSPERSFPTLRGHPPTVELGDRLEIPDEIEAPDTGVEIEVPPQYEYVYPVASLAYYLGATVVPGNVPQLVTETGFTYDLQTEVGFEREVEQVLKRTFLLDCVTRTEGLYEVVLHERTAVEPMVELDFAALYERPLAERLETYLDVPYGLLEPHVPDWKLTAHVADTPESVETLPFVVNDLAVVRVGTAGPDGPTESAPTLDPEQGKQQLEAVDSFYRSTRSEDPHVVTQPSAPTVTPPKTESMEQAWIGEGAPHGASKATAQAYRNRLELTPTEGDIDITVVCNDPAMGDEREVVDEVYGSQEELPFEVTLYEGLDTDELREVLAGDSAFFHYVGHIDPEGFECPDGTLDASTLDSTGIESFLLNACGSYDQGMALIEAGAVGGIVTLADVVNDSAVRIGSTIARLLNNGYPLRPALDIAKETSYMGLRYIVVGDGGCDIARNDEDTPILCELERDGDEFVLEIITYTSSTVSMGGFTKTQVPDIEKCYLMSGPIGTFTLNQDDLDKCLAQGDFPVKIDDELHWSGEIDTTTI